MFLIFSTTQSIPSKLIRFFTKKPYSHVAICGYSNDFGCWLVSEASHGEVKPVELENWLSRNYIIEIFEYKGKVRKSQMRWAAKQFDKPYSFITLPLMLFGFYYGDGDVKHICSEFVSKFFGMTKRENARPSDVFKYALLSRDFKLISGSQFLERVTSGEKNI